MIKVKYNRPFEVTQAQCEELRRLYEGIIAYRYDAGKWFVKVLIPFGRKENYLEQISQTLKSFA